ATSATFTPIGYQATQDLSLKVTASRPGYESVTVETDSAAIALGDAPAVLTPPKITGAATSCSTLSVSAGRWSMPGVTVTYQWYRDDAAIDGAEGPTYALTSHDIDAQFHVVVSARAEGYVVASAYPAPTAPIAPCP
ncbi:MAG: hypothetical protein QOI02_332, partial [Actinomycetota bacterium]|nr:hypothetical protein [Actinomycetota bacterium]